MLDREVEGELDRIYRWDGSYFGFVRNQNLLGADSTYLGWIDDDGRVWKADGSFLGEVVDDEYILRRLAMVAPVNRVPKVPPIPPIAPIPPINRIGRIARAGWVDALENFPD